MPEHTYHRPEQEDQTDTGNHTALGHLQQRLGKIQYLPQHGFLPGKFFHKLPLKHSFEPEAFSNPEQHRHDRNDGKQGIKGQGRGAHRELVFIKAAKSEDDNSELPN